MKKLLLVLLLVITAFPTLDAQSKPGLGIKGGLNYSIRTNFIFKAEEESLPGFHAGTYFHYFIFNFLAIQPEVLISQKGEKWTTGLLKEKFVLTYVDVPVLLRFQPISLLNIQAGPQFGYLIRARSLIENNGDKMKTDVKSEYEDWDIGLAFGVEFNLPFRVNISIRYIHGLSTVSYNFGTDKNFLFQLSAGFRIAGR
jgi:hypothetical protein